MEECRTVTISDLGKRKQRKDVKITRNNFTRYSEFMIDGKIQSVANQKGLAYVRPV